MITVKTVTRYNPTNSTDETIANFNEPFNKIAEMKSWLKERYSCNDFICKYCKRNERLYAASDSVGYVVAVFCTYKKGK